MRRQLEAVGMTRGEIERRVATGRLRPLHRGVCAVGDRVVPREGYFLAAVLACGPGATVSHRSAAALWSIRSTAQARTDVTVPTSRRGRLGIRFHETRLADDERTVLDRIPVTTPARTLLDLASVLDRRRLARAVNEAEVQRIFDGRALAALLDRYPRRHGAPALRAALAELDPGASMAESELEHRFRELIDNHALPPAEFNRWIEVPGRRYRVDALWADQRLIAEVDGYATHATRRQFEDDRARDLDLQLAGWRMTRFTWRQLRDHPDHTAHALRTLLGTDDA